jgi:hypothetical protein
MQGFFAASILTAASLAIAHPAAAITFPSLTTIYVGSGVYDSGDIDGIGQATSIHCSNVSGVAAQVRTLVLRANGAIAASLASNLAHGATFTFSTHQTDLFSDSDGGLDTGAISQGVVNVEATNSGIFCTAVVLDAQNVPPVFMTPLNLVRVNAHPGTVE